MNISYGTYWSVMIAASVRFKAPSGRVAWPNVATNASVDSQKRITHAAAAINRIIGPCSPFPQT
ncbi:hypothetical protein PAXRUDRAFT_823152 [Paxillus rubicundulus Ve08.2h10]|uniref:Uncharacterized protein n=1 Tax=Paxillus rubicundulus Ve08.2h10 TaxID=930991 RepID=A0A0D0DKN6_9AGAM|nr:hypothetical protein PAXRUDRAFT_823152 [Paxillus rubicundulus Ve08.2h10]